MTKMKLKNTLFLTALMLLLFSSTVKAQVAYTIYYQSSNAIYGISDLTGEPQIVASDISQTVYFSNSGHYAAYKDSEGIWISGIETWSPKRVISQLPRESFSLNWTPDDTRLILSLAFWPEDTDPTEQQLAYNLLTESAEPWIWGRCDQIAQHKVSKDFALICNATEDTPTHPIDTVALKWGGEFDEYAPHQYEILRGDLMNSFPRPLDWGVTESGQNIVYIAENPDYQFENERYSFWEINSLWNHGDNLSIDGPQQPFIEDQLVAVSNDRSMVAYSVFCGNLSDSCLQITDLHTGEITWSYRNTLRMEHIFYIVWYPDNQRVALLGDNIDRQHIIKVFDTETGQSIQYDVGNTSGGLAIP